MKPQREIVTSKLADASGFVDVSKDTLQHKKYANVFALGDCANLPTSKTAAAVAAQSDVVEINLGNVMKGANAELIVYFAFVQCLYLYLCIY